MSRLGIRLSVADRAGNAFSAIVTSMSLSTRVGKGSSRKVRNERATIGYGRAVTVLGRLTTVDGSPLADQEIVLSGTERRDRRRRRRPRPRSHRHRRSLQRHAARRPQPRRRRPLPGRVWSPAPLARGQPARPGQRDDPRRARLAARPGLDPLHRPPARPRRRAPAGRQDRRPPGLPARPLVDRRHHPHPRRLRHLERRRTLPRHPGPLPGPPAHPPRSVVPLRTGVLRLRGGTRPLRIALFFALALALVVAVPASAGTYEVMTCSPSGPGGVNNAWVVRPGRLIQARRGAMRPTTRSRSTANAADSLITSGPGTRRPGERGSTSRSRRRRTRGSRGSSCGANRARARRPRRRCLAVDAIDGDGADARRVQRA